ncbi:MAG: hypothetical protein JWO74_772 [Solirubrobacterales bacterium]|nr:hypothetical protein [Solirubrobacterales bacterium]
MSPTEPRTSETAQPPAAPRDDRAEARRGLSRRSFLRRAGLAGGTALVVAAGGVSYRAYDRGVLEAGEGGAYDAWRDWDKTKGPLALVSAAVLAANPHNSQAWVFRTTPTRIDIFADRRRMTGALDPFDREMYVGLGCALENLLQAAPANGYRAQVMLLPTPGQPVHAARIDLAPGPLRRAALYRAIPDRHTDRTAYRQQAVPAVVLAQMTALAAGLPGTRLYWYTDEADRGRIGTLMVDAARAITSDEQQSRDGFRLFRSSWDDIQKFKDGLTLDTQGLSEVTTALAKMLPASDRRSGDRFWVDATRKAHTKTAAAYGIVAVPDARDNRQRLLGGRLLERAHLWTARNGLSLHHMNQMTERADRERQLGLNARFAPAVQALVPDRGWQPLVAFRIGYPTGDNGRRRSPRRPAKDVVA